MDKNDIIKRFDHRGFKPLFCLGGKIMIWIYVIIVIVCFLIGTVWSYRKNRHHK